MDYQTLIESAKLVNDIQSATTTGDINYSGTALEICDEQGEDLFHIIIDQNGSMQALFFASEKNYRVPIELLERIITKAKEVVKKVE